MEELAQVLVTSSTAARTVTLGFPISDAGARVSDPITPSLSRGQQIDRRSSESPKLRG